jgi:hypothetical protein
LIAGCEGGNVNRKSPLDGFGFKLPAGCVDFVGRSGMHDWCFSGQPKETKKKGLIAEG